MIKNIFIGLIFLTVVAFATISYIFSQNYCKDSESTATKGIFFKNTINLNEYRNIAVGNDALGSYERYSRSDRHDEAITVYCKNYCKK